MTEVTDTQKRIYNTWLASTRGALNKPYSYRKNFDSLSSKDAYNLERLELLFRQYTYLNWKLFFQAPFKLFEVGTKSNNYYDLQYYCSQGAISAYAKYKRKLDEERKASSDFPDLTESVKFLADFCVRHNVSLKEYPKYKQSSDCIPLFVKHLKNRDLDPILFLALPGSGNAVYKDVGYDLFTFSLGKSAFSVFEAAQSKFESNSAFRKRAMTIVEKLHKCIEQKLSSAIQQEKNKQKQKQK